MSAALGRRADLTPDGLRLAKVLDDVEEIAGDGFYRGRRRTVTDGDIGEEPHEVEYEPLTAPVEAPVEAPAEPVPA